MRNPSKFRERFALYKQGKSPYKNGLIAEYEDGKEETVPVTTDMLQQGRDASKVVPGLGDEACAQFVNYAINSHGFNIFGNAWNPSNMSLVYSGYNTDDRPESYNEALVDAYNAKATKNFYDNFKSTEQLDTNKMYRVNMFYKHSRRKKDAYEEGRDGVAGTHTGLVMYNKDDKKWHVYHEINKKIYDDYFTKIQNPNNDYGITAIYEPRANNMFVNGWGSIVRSFGGSFKDGKTPNIVNPIYYPALGNYFDL